MRQTVKRVIKFMGNERNYGPTPEEIAELRRIGIEKEVNIFLKNFFINVVFVFLCVFLRIFTLPFF